MDHGTTTSHASETSPLVGHRHVARLLSENAPRATARAIREGSLSQKTRAAPQRERSD